MCSFACGLETLNAALAALSARGGLASLQLLILTLVLDGQLSSGQLASQQPLLIVTPALDGRLGFGQLASLLSRWSNRGNCLDIVIRF